MSLRHKTFTSINVLRQFTSLTCFKENRWTCFFHFWICQMTVILSAAWKANPTSLLLNLLLCFLLIEMFNCLIFKAVYLYLHLLPRQTHARCPESTIFQLFSCNMWFDYEIAQNYQEDQPWNSSLDTSKLLQAKRIVKALKWTWNEDIHEPMNVYEILFWKLCNIILSIAFCNSSSSRILF